MNKLPKPASSAAALSVRARFGHVALLLLSLTIGTIAGGMWLSGTVPPGRTAATLVNVAMVALAIAAYALGTLAMRRAPHPVQDIVAARMAFSFLAAALAGALGLGFADGNIAARWVAAGFAIELVVAGALLARARHAHRQAGGT